MNSRALLPALLCLLPAASPASRPMLPSSTAAPTCACRAAPAPNPGELSGLGVCSPLGGSRPPARLVLSARRAHAHDCPALVHDDCSQRQRRLQGDGSGDSCAHQRRGLLRAPGSISNRFVPFRSSGASGGPEMDLKCSETAPFRNVSVSASFRNVSNHFGNIPRGLVITSSLLVAHALGPVRCDYTP